MEWICTYWSKMEQQEHPCNTGSGLGIDFSIFSMSVAHTAFPGKCPASAARRRTPPRAARRPPLPAVCRPPPGPWVRPWAGPGPGRPQWDLVPWARTRLMGPIGPKKSKPQNWLAWSANLYHNPGKSPPCHNSTKAPIWGQNQNSVSENIIVH